MAIYESADGIEIEVDDNATDAQIQAVFNFERQQNGASNGAPQAAPQGAQNPALLNMMQGNVAQAPDRNQTILQRMGRAVAPVADAIQPYVKPGLQTAGAVLGSLGGGIAGGLIAGVPTLGGGAVPGAVAGGMAGGALGYGAGSQMGDLLNQLGGYEKPKSVGQTAMSIGNDVASGLAMEMAGPAAGKVLSGAGSLVQKVLPNTWKQAINGGADFTNAMRKNVKPEEISNIAKQGVADIRAGRSADYRASLEEISKIKSVVELKGTMSTLDEQLAKFGVKEGPNGTFDLSRSTVGREGQKDIKEALDLFKEWGSKPGDLTPSGVDLLKRRIGDIYSPNAGSQGFITSIEKALGKDLSAVVPEYAQMTKGYSEATNLLKDLRSITGNGDKANADLVIKRLVTAMKEDQSVKHELVKQLTNATGNNLEQMAAGYAMSKWIPSALAQVGTGTGAGLGALSGMISIKALPALAIASPRIRGEFVRMLGKTLMKAPKAANAAVRTGGILARNIGGQEE